jgi:methylamine dehydrogenase accessory protein MauD
MSSQAIIVSLISLWIVVLLMAIVIWALARQLGVLHERIGPVGALSLKSGLEIGAASPTVTVDLLSGSSMTIGAESDVGRSTLLFFFSPSCPVCKELMPILRSSAKSESDWLDIVLAGDGDPDEHLKIVSQQQMQDFPLTMSVPLGIAFRVGKLPYAALIDADGRLLSAGLVNSREHIESLYEAKELGVNDLQAYIEKNSLRQAS